MQKKINFYQVRGVAEVINATSEFLRENFSELMKAFLIIAGPAVFLSALVHGVLQAELLNLMAKVGKAGSTATMTQPFLFTFQYFIWNMILLCISLFFVTGVVYEYMDLYGVEQKQFISVSDVWKRIRRDGWLIFKTFAGLLLTIFAAFFTLFFSMTIMTAFAGISGVLANILGGTAGSILGGILAIIMLLFAMAGFLYFLSPLTLVFNVRIHERKKFFASLSRTYSLISGNRWKTIALLTICFVIQSSLSFIVYIPALIVGAYNTNTDSVHDFTLLFTIVNTLMLLVSYLLSVIFIIAISFQYFNLVERKEAVSVLRKVQAFETGTASTPEDEETY